MNQDASDFNNDPDLSTGVTGHSSTDASANSSVPPSTALPGERDSDDRTSRGSSESPAATFVHLNNTLFRMIRYVVVVLFAIEVIVLLRANINLAYFMKEGSRSGSVFVFDVATIALSLLLILLLISGILVLLGRPFFANRKLLRRSVIVAVPIVYSLLAAYGLALLILGSSWDGEGESLSWWAPVFVSFSMFLSAFALGTRWKMNWTERS